MGPFLWLPSSSCPVKGGAQGEDWGTDRGGRGVLWSMCALPLEKAPRHPKCSPCPGSPWGVQRASPTFLALCVFQAEAGLVALGHLGAIGGEEVVVGKNVHAVVVPGGEGGGANTGGEKPGRGVTWKPLCLGGHLLISGWGGGRKASCAFFSPGMPRGNPPCRKPPLTHGIHATPKSGAQPWGGSLPGRCCGSGRRNAGGAGAHRASLRDGRCSTSSSPLQHSRACAEGGPQCRPSLAPAGRGAAGLRQLQGGRKSWLGEMGGSGQGLMDG